MNQQYLVQKSPRFEYEKKLEKISMILQAGDLITVFYENLLKQIRYLQLRLKQWPDSKCNNRTRL
ncbi:hypothetical protein BpHYR1_051080 [Brachionus plicatilis]|uniref:Uncharacterized protein n=1 Tax=Brachionus plicatilis TaxID=10195 RepID=A0A3M7QW96_BRAPC|nr:hypothetical protein BpHYR1_051080 [Brachionus plicatilis]